MSLDLQIDSRKFCDENGRLYFYDNAKFLLIILVVVAHAISPFKADNYGIYVFWKIVNTFHMPLMIFISGFFSKRYIGKSGELKVQRTFSYFMLFLFSQLAVSLFEKFVLGANIHFSVVSARSSLWFLQCLGIWYLVLPFFSKIKPQFLIPISIIISLIIGYDDSASLQLSISRVFVHFPFFIAGYYFTPGMIAKLNSKFVRIFSIPVFALCVYIITLVFDFYPDKLVTCAYPYSTMIFGVEFPFLLQWVPRLIFYALAFISGASFLAVVPRVKVFFTRFGSRTLQVYILHRFLYLCWCDKKLAWWQTFNDMKYGIVIVFVIAVSLTFILSLKPFSYPFNAIQKISINRLLKTYEKKGKAQSNI